MSDRLFFRTRHLRNDSGLPFSMTKLAQDGEPIEDWDGSTVWGPPPAVPSKSASEFISVIMPQHMKLSRAQTHELFWRVHEVSVDASGVNMVEDVTYEDSSTRKFEANLSSLSAVTVTTRSNLLFGGPAYTPKELLAGKAFNSIFQFSAELGSVDFKTSGTDSVGDPIPPTSFSAPVFMIASIGFAFSGGDSTYYLRDGKIYPRTTLGVQCDRLLAMVDNAYVPDPVVAATVKVDLSGTAPVVQLTGNSDTTATGQIVITPTKWHPYADTTGAAAWGDTTGLPVNGGPVG